MNNNMTKENRSIRLKYRFYARKSRNISDTQ